MFTRCRRCRTKIAYGDTYCDKCKQYVIKKNKESLKDKKADDLLKTQRWRNLRADIIRRDKGCCVLCLKNKIVSYKRLQVHHIVKRTQDINLAFEPTNLVTLCRECHEKVELLSVEQQKELFGEIAELETYTLL